MNSYETLTEALEDLRKQGYTRDYNLKTEYLKCQQDGLELRPDEFTITSFYRFEGMTDPDDETILYAIEENNGQKGTLVSAYGPYADAPSADMVQKLAIRE